MSEIPLDPEITDQKKTVGDSSEAPEGTLRLWIKCLRIGEKIREILKILEGTGESSESIDQARVLLAEIAKEISQKSQNGRLPQQVRNFPPEKIALYLRECTEALKILFSDISVLESDETVILSHNAEVEHTVGESCLERVIFEGRETLSPGRIITMMSQHFPKNIRGIAEGDSSKVLRDQEIRSFVRHPEITHVAIKDNEEEAQQELIRYYIRYVLKTVASKIIEANEAKDIAYGMLRKERAEREVIERGVRAEDKSISKVEVQKKVEAKIREEILERKTRKEEKKRGAEEEQEAKEIPVLYTSTELEEGRASLYYQIKNAERNRIHEKNVANRRRIETKEESSHEIRSELLRQDPQVRSAMQNGVAIEDNLRVQQLLREKTEARIDTLASQQQEEIPSPEAIKTLVQEQIQQSVEEEMRGRAARGLGMTNLHGRTEQEQDLVNQEVKRRREGGKIDFTKALERFLIFDIEDIVKSNFDPSSFSLVPETVSFNPTQQQVLWREQGHSLRKRQSHTAEKTACSYLLTTPFGEWVLSLVSISEGQKKVKN